MSQGPDDRQAKPGALLAHHRDLIESLRAPSPEAPWRVLVSACLAGWPCGVEGDDYGFGVMYAELLALPTLVALPFCPEQFALGTPRNMPDIHGGDGFDVLAGRARIFDEHGEDLTERMLAGAQAMRDFALAQGAELALLTDMSAACGSQVISLGCRLKPDAERRWQKGVGVATAMLLQAGIPVLSQRDYHSLGLLRRRLDAQFTPTADAWDHHQHPWTLSHLPMAHPRA